MGYRHLSNSGNSDCHRRDVFFLHNQNPTQGSQGMQDSCAGYLSDPPGVMGVETTTLESPIGQRFSSRLSKFRFDLEVVQFRRVRCSSGAECSPHHRNSGLLGQFNPYIWGWVDAIALYIRGRRNFSKLRISWLGVRIPPGAQKDVGISCMKFPTSSF